MNISTMLPALGQGIVETLYMTVGGTILAYVLGIPVGVLLYITAEDGIKPNKFINGLVGVIVNVIRSIPFLILLVSVIPLTRIIAGTSIGSTATLVPLVIGSAPFVARMVESSLKEVDKGIIEAAQSMGASTWQIIIKVLLPEAKPSLLVGSTIAITTILGYSAMAGFTGGGGLGTIAVNYGYNRYQTDVMLVTVIILVVIVQVFQEVGMRVATAMDRRKK
ncbi:D-methionine transport system permease protein [Lachnospiraceae bacterium C7]|nr:D-methionine transport system permease protein [Lachnospiraceae bacterium C7]